MVNPYGANGAFSILDTRTRRLAATAGASYLGYFSTGIAALVNIPLARQHLPPELFGVWMMLSALLSFMAFADLGIANVVLNRTTQAQAAGDRQELQRTLTTGYVCTFAIGAALFLAWKAWSVLAPEPTSVAGTISPISRPEVMAALNIFVLILAISIPASLIQRVQLGMQQGYWSGIAQGCGALLTLIAVPMTLCCGGGMAHLIIATLGVQVGINLINTIAWLWRHRLLELAVWRHGFQLSLARRLIQSGALFFLLQLSASLAFQSDAIVITQARGQAAYGEFATVQKLFLIVSALLNATILGLWPAFGDAIARRDMEWVKKALRRGVALTITVSTFSVITLVLAMSWIMTHWMKSPINPPRNLLVLLAVWTVVDAVGGILAAFMNGANILRQQVGISTVMALAAITGKWLLAPVLGATGAVLATLLAYCLISLPGQVYILKRALSPRG